MANKAQGRAPRGFAGGGSAVGFGGKSPGSAGEGKELSPQALGEAESSLAANMRLIKGLS